MYSFQPLSVTYGGTDPNRPISTNNTPDETHWINDEYDWRKSNVKRNFNDERRFARRALLNSRWYLSFLSNSKPWRSRWFKENQTNDNQSSGLYFLSPWIAKVKTAKWHVESNPVIHASTTTKNNENMFGTWTRYRSQLVNLCSPSDPYQRNHILRLKSNDRCHSNEKYVKKTFECKNGPHTLANPIFVHCRQRLSHFDA